MSCQVFGISGTTFTLPWNKTRPLNCLQRSTERLHANSKSWRMPSQGLAVEIRASVNLLFLQIQREELARRHSEFHKPHWKIRYRLLHYRRWFTYHVANSEDDSRILGCYHESTRKQTQNFDICVTVHLWYSGITNKLDANNNNLSVISISSTCFGR